MTEAISRIGATAITREDVSWTIYEMDERDRSLGPPRIASKGILVSGSEKPMGDLRQVIASLSGEFLRHGCDRISVSCFGPFDSIGERIDDEASFGRISKRQSTLNAGGQNVIELFHEHCGIEKSRIHLTTDANAVALGELVRRASMPDREAPFEEVKDPHLAQAYRNVVLVALIFGKGIGGGVTIGGEPLQRNFHPEMGHIPVTRMYNDSRPDGCAYHIDCATGLAQFDVLDKDKNGILSRRGLEQFAFYAAQVCAAATYMLGPDAIVLAGSTIFAYPQSIALIREETKKIFVARGGASRPGFIKQESSDRLGAFITPADPHSYLLGTLAHGIARTRQAASVSSFANKKGQMDVSRT